MSGCLVLNFFFICLYIFFLSFFMSTIYSSIISELAVKWKVGLSLVPQKLMLYNKSQIKADMLRFYYFFFSSTTSHFVSFIVGKRIICIKVSSKTATGSVLYTIKWAITTESSNITHIPWRHHRISKKGGSEIHEKATRKIFVGNASVDVFHGSESQSERRTFSIPLLWLVGLLPGKVLSYVFELLLAFSCKYEHYASHVWSNTAIISVP